jgi:hypothetical protein
MGVVDQRLGLVRFLFFRGCQMKILSLSGARSTLYMHFGLAQETKVDRGD